MFAAGFGFTGCGGPRLAVLESGWADFSFRVAGRWIRQHCRIVARECSCGTLVGLLIAKSLMWAFSLSSGTSGGVWRHY